MFYYGCIIIYFAFEHLYIFSLILFYSKWKCFLEEAAYWPIIIPWGLEGSVHYAMEYGIFGDGSQISTNQNPKNSAF